MTRPPLPDPDPVPERRDPIWTTLRQWWRRRRARPFDWYRDDPSMRLPRAAHVRVMAPFRVTWPDHER